MGTHPRPWYRRLSIAFKLILAFALILILVTTSLALFLARAFERDKLAYAMDLTAAARDVVLERLSRHSEKIAVLETREADRVARFIAGSNVDATEILLFRPEGKVLWRNASASTAKARSRTDLTDAKIFTLYSKSNLASATTTVPGEPGSDELFVVSFAEIPESNSIIAIIKSFHDIMLPIRRLVDITIYLGLVLALIGSFALAGLFVHLWAPVRQLEMAAKRIGSGDYTFSFDYPNEDEASRLFSAIEEMAALLRARDALVRHSTRGLERIVSSARSAANAQNANDVVQGAFDVLMPFLREEGGRQVVICQPSLGMANRAHALPEGLEALALNQIPQGVSLPAEGRATHRCPIVVEKIHVADLVFIAPVDDASSLPSTLGPIAEGVAANVRAALTGVHLQTRKLLSVLLESELEAGRAVQNALVRIDNQPPGYVRIDHSYTPASKTGGDVLLVFRSKESLRLYFFVGDVTGHGVSAALVSAQVVGVVRGWKEKMETLPWEDARRELGKLIQSLDRVLWETCEGSHSLTLVGGMLEVNTGHLHYVNCAHPWPVLVDGNATRVPRCRPARALGRPGELELVCIDETVPEPGGLFLYTDGLTDIPLSKRNFGVKQIREILSIQASESALDAGKRTLETLQREAGVEQSKVQLADDVTLLLLRRTRHLEETSAA